MLSENSAVLAEAMCSAHLQRLAELVAADMQVPSASAPEVMDAAELAAVALVFRLAYRRGGSRRVRTLQGFADAPADHQVARVA